jgi:hypothetical protein
VKVWNQWRKEVWDQWKEKENDLILPDLSNVNLSNIDFNGADLSYANLKFTNLNQAHLRYADLHGAELNNASLREARLTEANLRRIDLSGANLDKAEILVADLTSAILDRAILIRASLNHSNLSGGFLGYANLTDTDLSEVDLIEADLRYANLTHVGLYKADLTGAIVDGTVFGNNDLSTVKGIETIRHIGPSVIDLATIYRSKGNIPQDFLRRAGVPDNFITYMGSLTGKAFEFYSCFISYSSTDQEFAERLHVGLRHKRVRCWFAPEDLKIGDKIRPRIDETIRSHDKLLLILSENSVESQWVEQEVETSLDQERQQGRTVLFPIRLDDTVRSYAVGERVKSGFAK